MIVWTVWERVHDWPENGGGDYLNRIFQTEEDAQKYCEQKNREMKEEEEDIAYYVEKWPVY